jgi:hypothetical protein
MDQYIIYNTDYKVLICRQHGYAVAQNNVSRHFQRYHKATAFETHQAVADYAKSLLWDIE